MPLEIERKFLVKTADWRGLAPGILYRQGYLLANGEKTVRVRVADDRGWLTIKGATVDVVRSEYEYPIPVEDAVELLNTLCERPLIEKRRHRIAIAALIWEVDEFLGENQGLTIAEVELSSSDQVFDRPSWLGAEVSHDPRYFNASLVRHPFSRWAIAERPPLS